MKLRKSKPPSVIALIAVNLYPVFGVLFWGWDVFPIMFLFWSENIMIGFYNILKMIICQPKEPTSWFEKAFMVPFFTIHYGGFTAGHGIFVITMFGQGILEGAEGPKFDALMEALGQYRIFLAMFIMFLSHGFSFITNYLGKGEFRNTSLSTLMMRPYGRVVILHITLIFGGFLVMSLNSPAMGLIFFIVLKIIMDLFAHMREHRKAQNK
jgi:hypothetical protein